MYITQPEFMYMTQPELNCTISVQPFFNRTHSFSLYFQFQRKVMWLGLSLILSTPPLLPKPRPVQLNSLSGNNSHAVYTHAPLNMNAFEFSTNLFHFRFLNYKIQFPHFNYLNNSNLVNIYFVSNISVSVQRVYRSVNIDQKNFLDHVPSPFLLFQLGGGIYCHASYLETYPNLTSQLKRSIQNKLFNSHDV